LNILKQNKKIICVVTTTIVLIATIVYFNVYRFCGYKVSIGSNTITFVKSKKEFNKTYEQLQSEIKSKYGNVITIKDFTLNRIKVTDNEMFISGDKLKSIMLKKFNIVVDVFLMKSDNKKIAYVESENQGKQILSSIKDYYYKQVKLNSLRKVDIDNNISYERAKVKIGYLYENTEIVKEIIKYNNDSQTALLNVKVVGDVTKNQIIYPTTIMKSSDKLMSGESKLYRKGINGMKKVTTEVITLNNNIVLAKVLKSQVIKPVQNKEIYVGINNPIVPKIMPINSPSRGDISSSFGTRWGKMHEGIDIAANFGSTISAALDGTVNYAAWEEGYGNVIKIDNGSGIETTYAHCSVIMVKKGEVVKRGIKIGEVGSTGHSTGPHLHFEVRINGKAINPEKYIK